MKLALSKTYREQANCALFGAGKLCFVRRVSNAALANATLVLSSKNWKNIQDGGKSKKPWVFCRCAGIDAALVGVQFVLRGCAHH